MNNENRITRWHAILPCLFLVPCRFELKTCFLYRWAAAACWFGSMWLRFWSTYTQHNEVKLQCLRSIWRSAKVFPRRACWSSSEMHLGRLSMFTTPLVDSYSRSCVLRQSRLSSALHPCSARFRRRCEPDMIYRWALWRTVICPVSRTVHFIKKVTILSYWWLLRLKTPHLTSIAPESRLNWSILRIRPPYLIVAWDVPMDGWLLPPYQMESYSTRINTERLVIHSWRNSDLQDLPQYRLWYHWPQLAVIEFSLFISHKCLLSDLLCYW